MAERAAAASPRSTESRAASHGSLIASSRTWFDQRRRGSRPSTRVASLDFFGRARHVTCRGPFRRVQRPPRPPRRHDPASRRGERGNAVYLHRPGRAVDEPPARVEHDGQVAEHDGLPRRGRRGRSRGCTGCRTTPRRRRPPAGLRAPLPVRECGIHRQPHGGQRATTYGSRCCSAWRTSSRSVSTDMPSSHRLTASR